MLSEIATRVLASIKSFSATKAASAAHVAALQRVGSFAPPKGVDLAEALQRAAHEGPCDRHAPAPGGGAGGEDSSAASRPSADAATAAAAVYDSCDQVLERNPLAGADVCAALAIGAPQTAIAGANASTSGGGAVAEAQLGIGGAGPFARLRRRAESGEHAPCRSNLTTAGDSLTWAAAPDPACGGRPAGAEQARSPLAAAPVLGTSGAADARNGSAATADIISSEAGADVKQKAVTEDEHKTGSFRQKLKRLLLIRASGPSTSAGRAPGAGAPDAEIQQAVQSEKDLRHEQVLALAAPSPWVLPDMSSSSMEIKSG